MTNKNSKWSAPKLQLHEARLAAIIWRRPRLKSHGARHAGITWERAAVHMIKASLYQNLYKIAIFGRSTHCGSHCTVMTAIEDPPKRTFWKPTICNTRCARRPLRQIKVFWFFLYFHVRNVEARIVGTDRFFWSVCADRYFPWLIAADQFFIPK